ncbi:LytTR family transcriptional regulator DNA-binding domain-containing protein [Paenibacillus abyssi]|uniref:HTH LytTR-type domain-containing protein n=1 Tax=Paenibacillus abyssi TaxID=1340531 RepID=A0A917FX34_9BACL|nr:LytTR family transcriptional regulator DNA-binding domain-containing protein [Paenibacillus abyssi]GGG09700.1 hypothetical protein GCM10010916_28220 [Paenibacillus abyssi]
MQLSVTRDVEGKSGFCSVSIDDIVFIEFDRILNRLYVHTIDNIYYTMGTLKYFVEGLNGCGYDFRLVDRNNAVHLLKIKRLDQKHKIAYFEEEISKKSKRCTIAYRNFDEVVTILEKLNQPVVIA